MTISDFAIKRPIVTIVAMLILVIFGIFEKNRAELMRIVQSMRSWEP